VDEQVKQHLISYLDKLEAAVQKGADIAAEQLPLALQEYIAYCRIDSTISVIFAALVFVVSAYGLKKAVAAEKADKYPFSPLPLFGIVFSAVALVGSLVAFSTNYPVCIKAWVAPAFSPLKKSMN